MDSSKSTTAENFNENNKRNLAEYVSAEGSPKMIKNTRKGGIFSENDIPEGTFAIGDCTFVYASTFRGSVCVHIRRFTKYGSTFYPSKEGVTLHPRWIECFMKKGSPKTPRDLHACCCAVPKKLFKIESADFENFIFSRLKTTPRGETNETSITLSSEQWTEMKQQYNGIAESVLGHVYDAMDLLGEYKTLEQDANVNSNLPDSLDVNLGTQCLLQLLRESLSYCLKERGMMDPIYLAGEVCANRVENFNSAAFSVDVSELAEVFYKKLWENKDFLCLGKPAMYVTPQFFKDFHLKDILREVRDVFCPPNAFEYFEDFENYSM